VEVVVNPGPEVARTDRFAQPLAHVDLVAWRDRGVDVHHPHLRARRHRQAAVGGLGLAPRRVDDDEVVLVGGVRFRRRRGRLHRSHLAGDRGGRLAGVGVQVDGAAALVCGVRGVVQRHPSVAAEQRPREHRAVVGPVRGAVGRTAEGGGDVTGTVGTLVSCARVTLALVVLAHVYTPDAERIY
jgi:hypothetical protein